VVIEGLAVGGSGVSVGCLLGVRVAVGTDVFVGTGVLVGTGVRVTVRVGVGSGVHVSRGGGDVRVAVGGTKSGPSGVRVGVAGILAEVDVANTTVGVNTKPPPYPPKA